MADMLDFHPTHLEGRNVQVAYLAVSNVLHIEFGDGGIIEIIAPGRMQVRTLVPPKED